MQLQLGEGVTLTSLEWAITDTSQRIVLSSGSPGQQAWHGRATSTVGFVIGGVPEGNDYVITLSGTASAGDSCVGSAAFGIVHGQLTRTTVQVVCTTIPTVTPGDVKTGGVLVNGTVTRDVAPPVNCPGISSFSVSPAVIVDGEVAELAVGTVGPAPSGIVWTATSANETVGVFSSGSAFQTTFSCNAFVGTATVTATLSGPSGCAGLPFTTVSAPIVCEPPGGVCDEAMPAAAGTPVYIDLSSGTPVVTSSSRYFWTGTPIDGVHTSVTPVRDGVWQVDIGFAGAYRGTLYPNYGVELSTPASGDLVLSYGIDWFTWNDLNSWTLISSTVFTRDSLGQLAGRTPRVSDSVVPKRCLVPDEFQLAVPGITTEWDTLDIYIKASNQN